jgi:hypothetical protein
MEAVQERARTFLTLGCDPLGALGQALLDVLGALEIRGC